MIDVAIPKFGDDDAQPTSRPSVNPVVGHSSFARSRPEEDDEEYNVENEDSGSDSEESDDGTEKGQDDKEEEGGDKDVFFDTQDIAEGVSFESLSSDVLKLTFTPSSRRSRTFIRRRSSSLSKSIASKPPSSAPIPTPADQTAFSPTLSSRASASSSACGLTI